MKYVLLGLVLAAVVGAIWKLSRLMGGTIVKAPSTQPMASHEKSVLDFTVRGIDGSDLPLSQFKGKVVLIVNVASRCGFTGQYAGLETTYQKYRERGLVVVGFPSNDFGGQEPGSEAEIQSFCQMNYGVTFPMAAKVNVKSDPKHEVYRFLTEAPTAGEFAGEVKWNFSKYLIDRHGRVIAFFPSMTGPDSEKIQSAIEAALSQR
jgi:glutathione peroxidase